jgi:hypothetical protein
MRTHLDPVDKLLIAFAVISHASFVADDRQAAPAGTPLT